MLLPALPCLCRGEHFVIVEFDIKLTLATTPAQSNPAASDREALHLLDSALRIGLSDELNETAMLAHRDLDLRQT